MQEEYFYVSELIVAQLVKKFRIFYTTRRIYTLFKETCHWFLFGTIWKILSILLDCVL
jgi:hypothetical protein